MKLLEKYIDEIRDYIEQKKSSNARRIFRADHLGSWPKSDKSGIVLLPDLSVELGNPDDASVSFQTWTEDASLVNDGDITLIGADICEASTPNLPFGKIVIAQVEDFDENNAADRTREMFLSKFDLSLSGFMLKSASNYMAEWCRISKDAVSNHFSFKILGSSLINELKNLDYVKSVEIIFITSSNNDVNELFDIGNRSLRTLNAMAKMVNEMSYDCGECEYSDICNEADELREIRDKIANEK